MCRRRFDSCRPYIILSSQWLLRRWHWNEISCKTGRGVEGRKGSGWQKKRSQAHDLFRPCDVSGAGRGRNWEWHSWLELPNCHFLSSLFTHSRSLSRTFEERRTDMCLLVQPSLLTVITVVHEHSINYQHPSAWHGRGNGEQEGSGASMQDSILYLFVNKWNTELCSPSLLPVFSSFHPSWCIIAFGGPRWLGTIKSQSKLNS